MQERFVLISNNFKKRMITKKSYILFVLIILLFLFLSCSSEVMLDISSYYGEMYNIFNDNKGEIEVDFSGTKSIELELEVDTWDGDRDIIFKGTYFIESNYYFCAVFDLEDIDYNVVLWKNIIDSSGIEDLDDIDLDDYESIQLKLELEGYLNYCTGNGEGDYKVICKAELETGEVKKGQIKDDWELVKY
jgi:hypothetical protein